MDSRYCCSLQMPMKILNRKRGESALSEIRAILILITVPIAVLTAPIFLWFWFLFLFAIPGISFNEYLDVPSARQMFQQVTEKGLSARTWFGGEYQVEKKNYFVYSQSYGSPFTAVFRIESDSHITGYDSAVIEASVESGEVRRYQSSKPIDCSEYVGTADHCVSFLFEDVFLDQGSVGVNVSIRSEDQTVVDLFVISFEARIKNSWSVNFWEALMGI